MKASSKDERSMLLYMETCLVDHGGLLQNAKMNDEDRAIAKRWNEEKYIKFGRIAAHSLIDKGFATQTHWVEFTPEAWADAHAERKARAERTRDDDIERLHFLGGKQQGVNDGSA